MPTRSELEAAYRATIYRVRLPDAVCDLRIGQADRKLTDWLKFNGYGGFVIITAYNPGARLATLTVNRSNQQKLRECIAQAGVPYLEACNIADAGDWPEEPSLLLAGVSEEQGSAWARAFGQNAIVVGGGDGVPRLVWMRQEA